MRISTKGRYALRMMLEFALSSDSCTKISQVSERQQISTKYLEQIVTMLNHAGFVKSVRGAQGGYYLTRKPEEYTVGEILRVVEGSLSPVPCLDGDTTNCDRASSCATLTVWQQIKDAVENVVDHVTLADLLEEQKAQPDKNLL